MSGTVTNATADYGVLGLLIANGAKVKQSLDTLTQQASSGMIAPDYAGLGAGAPTSLVLAPALAHQTTWSNNVNVVSGQMQVAQTALNQISSIASTFYGEIANLNGLNPGNVDVTAASARSALTEMAGLLDTTDNGEYVFAGQDSANPPVPDPDNILDSSFTTQIAVAVGGLNVNGAVATISATLATAGSNAVGTSPFSTALSQPGTALAGLRPTVQVGDGQFVPVGILASGNADVASTGSSTTGSYMRDIMRALATLGSLSSSQVGDAGFQPLLSDTYASLGDAITALNGDAGVMGNRQTQLTKTQTEIGNVSTSMQTQVSNAQDVDLAATLSKLSLVETQLQSSYKLIATVQGLSLTNFLPLTG